MKGFSFYWLARASLHGVLASRCESFHGCAYVRRALVVCMCVPVVTMAAFAVPLIPKPMIPEVGGGDPRASASRIHVL